MEADTISSSDSEDDEPSSPTQPELGISVTTHAGSTVKLEVPPSWSYLRQVEPPREQTLEKTYPTLSFPDLDPMKFQPIKISLSLPVTRLSSLPYEPHTQSQINLSVEQPSSSSSLVHVSACRGRLKVARRQSLNSIGIPSWSDEKKLLAAVRSNNICTVIRLLDDGINPNISDSKKRTALHIAASQGLDHIVSTLAARRADPNKIDILGNSPLHLAACRGDTRIVRILIGSGADIHKKDKTGRTPLDIVKSRLNTLRQDRSISTDKLIGECQMIFDVLRIHAERLPYSESNQVDALCSRMANVSTREQVDECADAMLNQMSSLSLEHKGRMQSLKTN